MSDMESHRGRLFPIKRVEGEDEFDYTRRALEKDFSFEYYEEFTGDIGELIYELDLYDEYFFVNGIFYKNVDHKRLDPYSNVQELEGNDVDGYEYFMMFYNGGVCLSEMIEESLKKLDKTS